MTRGIPNKWEMMNPFLLGLHLQSSISKLSGQIEELTSMLNSNMGGSLMFARIGWRLIALTRTKEQLEYSLNKVLISSIKEHYI